jgi:hypothetical protein
MAGVPPNSARFVCKRKRWEGCVIFEIFFKFFANKNTKSLDPAHDNPAHSPPAPQQRAYVEKMLTPMFARK